MQNPEQLIDMVAQPERKPFDPNPVMFPVTWIPLRLLQMVAVARVVSTDPEEYLWCPIEEGDQVPKILEKFLFQLALSDEWYRVFIREKRVGLGIAVMVVYYFAMLSLLVSCAMLNGKATLLMVPSFVAIIVSGWMNIVIFWNRYETNRQRERNTPSKTMWSINSAITKVV
jgi:tryptophan-rich sensory protein